MLRLTVFFLAALIFLFQHFSFLIFSFYFSKSAELFRACFEFLCSNYFRFRSSYIFYMFSFSLSFFHFKFFFKTLSVYWSQLLVLNGMRSISNLLLKHKKDLLIILSIKQTKNNFIFFLLTKLAYLKLEILIMTRQSSCWITLFGR